MTALTVPVPAPAPTPAPPRLRRGEGVIRYGIYVREDMLIPWRLTGHRESREAAETLVAGLQQLAQERALPHEYQVQPYIEFGR